jgi:magnesium chelatase subunit D
MTTTRAGTGCDAALAACIFAVDPAVLGGLRLRIRSGPLCDRLVALARSCLPASSPFRKLPLSIADNRLIGGLDLAATLRSGRPVLERGMMADCDGGVIMIACAERMTAPLAAKLAAALDDHEIAIERDGFTARSRCRVGVLVLDEGMEPDERPPSVLLERLGLQVTAGEAENTVLPFRITRIEAARQAWRGVTADDDILHALCQAASMLGVTSARAPVFALQVAKIHAALHQREIAGTEDVMAAARLVYALRATTIPAQAAPEPNDPPPDQEREDDRQPEPNAPLEDIVIAAVRAAIPQDLLAQLRPQVATSSRAGAAGAAGRQRQAMRGRPVGSRAGDLSAGSRLHVIDTLRAAAPWQMLRR